MRYECSGVTMIVRHMSEVDLRAADGAHAYRYYRGSKRPSIVSSSDVIGVGGPRCRVQRSSQRLYTGLEFRTCHIVSLTRRRAARGGAKRQEGRSGRMRLRRDPRDRGAPAAAPGRPRDRTTGAPRATQAPRHGRERRTNAEQPPRSQIARPRPRVGRRLTYRLHAPRDTHTAQAHTSRPARPRDLQPVRTVAPLPKHAHECPCML